MSESRINEVYILCHGVGNYTGFDNRVIDPSKDHVFQLLDYRSLVKEGGIRNIFYVCDWLALLWDLKMLNKKETASKSIQLSRPNQIKKLVELIKEYLTKTINLTLIGVSHGSLLMHAAILRLQVELSPELLRKLNTIIRFYTIGSPRHPLPQLFAKVTIANPINEYGYATYPLINFYHKDDHMLPTKALNIWGTTRHPLQRKKTAQIVPLEETTSSHTFNPSTSVFLHYGDRVQNISHYPKTWDIIDNHTSVYMLYPIWINKTLVFTKAIKVLQILVQISTPLYHLSILYIPIKKFKHLTLFSFGNIYYADSVQYNLIKYKEIINSHICQYNEDEKLIYVTGEKDEQSKSRRKSAPKAPSSSR